MLLDSCFAMCLLSLMWFDWYDSSSMHGRETFVLLKHLMFVFIFSYRSLLPSVRLNMYLASKISTMKCYATTSRHHQISFCCLQYLKVQKSWTDFLINQSMPLHSCHYGWNTLLLFCIFFSYQYQKCNIKQRKKSVLHGKYSFFSFFFVCPIALKGPALL